MILSEIISFTLLYTRGWFDEGRFILDEHLQGAYASWESSRDRVWRNGNAAEIPTELVALSAFILCDFRTFRRNLVKANSSRSLASPYRPLGTAPLDASRARWNPFRRCNIPGQVYSF